MGVLAIFFWFYAAFAEVPSQQISGEAQPIAATSLGRRGEEIGGATLTEIRSHPEYQRYRLEWPDGSAIVLELTWYDSAHEGLCNRTNLALFPRPELLPDRPQPPNASDTYKILCERLSTSEPPLQHLGQATSAPPFPYLSLTPSLLLLSLLLYAFRRPSLALEATLWSLAALFFRLWRTEAGIFNGGGAGYEKLVIALGKMQENPYGPGFRWVMQPGLALFGESAAGVYATNLLFSSATVGLLFAWGRAAGGTGRGPAFLGMLLPVWMMMARSEEMSVSWIFFAVLAMACVTAFRRGTAGVWAGVAGLSVWMAAQIRPEAMVFVPVVMVNAFRRERLGWQLFLWGILGWTVWSRMGMLAGGQDVLHPEALLSYSNLNALFRPAFSEDSRALQQLVLHFRYTPPLLPILTLYGLFRSSASERLRFTIFWSALTLPFVTKVYPLADLLRLQSPALIPWIFVGGAALEVLAQRDRRIWGIFLIGLLPWWWHPQPDWINQLESRWLQQVVPTLPEVEIVVPDTRHRAEKFREIMETFGRAHWVDGNQSGPWLYLGTACLQPGPCADLVAHCQLRVRKTLELPPQADLDVDMSGRASVRIGFYEGGDCDAGRSQRPVLRNPSGPP